MQQQVMETQVEPTSPRETNGIGGRGGAAATSVREPEYQRREAKLVGLRTTVEPGEAECRQVDI